MTAPFSCDLPLPLLRLISPSLPVGTFSYSRGLEGAVQAGWVTTEAAARHWILGTLETSFAALDGALFWRMMEALWHDDPAAFHAADAWLAAGRESLELQLEDRRMAESLLSLLRDLDVPLAPVCAGKSGQAPPPAGAAGVRSYPAAFAIAAHHWGIGSAAALTGLMWSVVEAQVAAAIRLVPLGHTAGQRILIAAVPVIARAAARASTLEDEAIGNMSPALAMASAWHETQYSRLFRS